MPNTEVNPRVHVAVGVVFNSLGQILIARRHEGAHQGGLWEFPGGKVELGESVCEALFRELDEELGISIHTDRCVQLIEIQHSYSDKDVLLDVWLVSEFTGEAVGKEGQPLCWVTPDKLSEYQFPKANEAIIDAILNGLNEK